MDANSGLFQRIVKGIRRRGWRISPGNASRFGWRRWVVLAFLVGAFHGRVLRKGPQSTRACRPFLARRALFWVRRALGRHFWVLPQELVEARLLTCQAKVPFLAVVRAFQLPRAFLRPSRHLDPARGHRIADADLDAQPRRFTDHGTV